MSTRKAAIEELAGLLVGVTADGRRMLSNGDEETRKPTYEEAGLFELADRKRLVVKRAKVRDLLAVMVGVEIEPICSVEEIAPSAADPEGRHLASAAGNALIRCGSTLDGDEP